MISAGGCYWCHYVFQRGWPTLLITAISCLPTQSGCSQITVVIETKSVAGKYKSAFDLGENAVKGIDVINYTLYGGTQCKAEALQK